MHADLKSILCKFGGDLAFACEKKRFVQKFTDGQTDGRTDGQTTDGSPWY